LVQFTNVKKNENSKKLKLPSTSAAANAQAMRMAVVLTHRTGTLRHLGGLKLIKIKQKPKSFAQTSFPEIVCKIENCV